jgi:hypothetical protein
MDRQTGKRRDWRTDSLTDVTRMKMHACARRNLGYLIGRGLLTVRTYVRTGSLLLSSRV